MSYSETTIIARGYEVTLPTAAVQAFLSLSHDDQVELADVLNDMGVNEIDEEQSTTDLLIESMASELDAQDHAIEMHMIERFVLLAERDEARADRKWLGARAQELIASREANRGEIDNLNEILVQSARYVGQVRELLGRLGLTIETDHVAGTPVLVIDGDRFEAAAAVVDEVRFQ